MAQNEWQRRIARAEELGAQYTFAAEILRFYAAIARFQENFDGILKNSSAGANDSDAFTQPLPPELTRRFEPLLSVVEGNGPTPLREAARELRDDGEHSQFQLLAAFWDGRETGALPGPGDFFARAFLQPYAAYIRSQSSKQWSGPTPSV